MYENFFGLFEKPFNVTPDTHYLYPSPQHEGVINTLFYGIQEKKGFSLLVGEVGTGKTTSLRALLNRLGPNVRTSLILNPLLSSLDLISAINRDFGCRVEGDSLTDQLEALNAFVLENYQKGQNAVVIIDEAQNLSIEALEMTRLLSNLETETDKLLQIILVGQPELEAKLAQPALRQLWQRIQIYCQLKALDAKQIAHYVHHRIQRAGNNPSVVFEKSAYRELEKISRGIPRVINKLCDMALLAAFARGTRVIDRSLIQQAAKETPTHVHHP